MNYHLELDIDFKRNPFKGKYIVIEGIDGSGKTTQAKRLCEYFEKSNLEVVCTGEPRKRVGVVGELIYKILRGKVKIPSVAFQYLFSADRAIHHEELIIPALKDGKYVISDRSFWSAIPYGILDKMGEENYDFQMGKVILSAQSILSMYHQFIIPDITFYLDVPVEVAVKRMADENKQKEIYEKTEKLDKIIAGYKWLVKEFPKEFVIIDGKKSADEVTKELIKRIDTLNNYPII
ncbi:dTMP kinase [Candidatus Microgenomates bacterium]|nr:MAG: dTMP kinase [Candidatus Microgenomates bacterium]